MSTILDLQERRHPIVVKLAKHLAERLAEHRAMNDHPQSPELTAALRGQIAEAKQLLDLLATGES